ncbi:uncharacterized protein [Gossypium hirsutum]|uniref:Gag-Pol polyprotein n=1 Tax=Gossypium hirsutum TaxID=3635 RepID=A0ABM3BWF8_GOSHI|nr:uncharacterized protein LOC121230538 [Gossypium hirsutum]
MVEYPCVGCTKGKDYMGIFLKGIPEEVYQSKVYRSKEEGISRIEERLKDKLREFVVLVERAGKAKKLAKEKRKADIESRDSRKRLMGKSQQTLSKISREFPTQSNTSMGFSNKSKNKQNTTSKAQTTSMMSVGSVRPNRLKCSQCGRCHFGECRANKRGSFKFGSLDHFIRDCPELDEKEKKQA